MIAPFERDPDEIRRNSCPAFQQPVWFAVNSLD